MLVGQQAQPVSPKQTAQTTTAKSSVAPTHKAAAHRAVRKRHTTHKRKRRRDYRPEYSENSVEVINGDAAKKVVFHNDKPAATPGKKRRAGMKNVPAPMKVEVVNGTSSDTQYFYDNGQAGQSETAHNQPVVIGIQSSDTRTVGGNKHPVVTSVTSSGVQDGKSVGSGGQAVTKQVSPRPKRPVYRPEPH
jgi:hypothetical protein